ncbi:MAG: hypothetical protein Q8S73_16760 [Deltaproteobacteria bacterium]|nr:hypothetical protein [Myxococcales bacterium]MDP3215760.1 hypothetical protein [Deltaproteobacteria bacterium]
MTAGHVLLREWETRSPGVGADDPLRGRTLDRAGAELAGLLGARRMLDVREVRHGLEVRSSSFVGRVRLGDLTLTITPKLDAETLLALFPYAYGLRNVARGGDALFETQGVLLQDLMIEMLHDEVDGLLQRGLPRRYRPRREDLASPRGRIDMNALASLASAPGTLPCEHHVRSEDWALHRVLLAGLRHAAGLTATPALRVRLLRLAARLGDRVSSVELHGCAITEALRGLDRLTRACGPALRLIEALHRGHLLSLDESREGVVLPGFLFDMNRFFQALLSRFLGENLADHEVVDEHSLHGLMRYAHGANPRRRAAPTPRPDFAIRAGNRLVALLDAKYRDLWERTLPREMLYQLSIYALSQGVGASATILYPTADVAARDARIELRGPLEGWGRASVVLRPVSLRALKDAVAGVDDAPTRQRRRLLAQHLVFGAA